jgi:hypothetical protein
MVAIGGIKLSRLYKFRKNALERMCRFIAHLTMPKESLPKGKPSESAPICYGLISRQTPNEWLSPVIFDLTGAVGMTGISAPLIRRIARAPDSVGRN